MVATPEMRLKKLRATRSLFKISLAFPYTMATTFPLFIFLPSFDFDLKTTFLSEYLKASLTKSNLPITQFWFEIIFALIFLLFLMSLVVMSPEGF